MLGPPSHECAGPRSCRVCTDFVRSQVVAAVEKRRQLDQQRSGDQERARAEEVERDVRYYGQVLERVAASGGLRAAELPFTNRMDQRVPIIMDLFYRVLEEQRTVRIRSIEPNRTIAPGETVVYKIELEVAAPRTDEPDDRAHVHALLEAAAVYWMQFAELARPKDAAGGCEAACHDPQ